GSDMGASRKRFHWIEPRRPSRSLDFDGSPENGAVHYSSTEYGKLAVRPPRRGPSRPAHGRPAPPGRPPPPVLPGAGPEQRRPRPGPGVPRGGRPGVPLRGRHGSRIGRERPLPARRDAGGPRRAAVHLLGGRGEQRERRPDRAETGQGAG